MAAFFRKYLIVGSHSSVGLFSVAGFAPAAGACISHIFISGDERKGSSCFVSMFNSHAARAEPYWQSLSTLIPVSVLHLGSRRHSFSDILTLKVSRIVVEPSVKSSSPSNRRSPMGVPALRKRSTGTLSLEPTIQYVSVRYGGCRVECAGPVPRSRRTSESAARPHPVRVAGFSGLSSPRETRREIAEPGKEVATTKEVAV